MMRHHKSGYERVRLSAILVCAGLLSGCITPTLERYTFIENNATYRIYADAVYNPEIMNVEDAPQFLFSYPQDALVSLEKRGKIVIVQADNKPVALRAGVYPFRMRTLQGKQPIAVGALMVYNVDKTVALATLGKTPETQLFNPKLVEKARTGELATYTLKFDDTAILTYWLGNRRTLYAGGAPTVELDFAGTAGISRLRFGRQAAADFVAVLPVYAPKTATRQEHAFEMICDGRTYRGYVRNLQDNEFTAFVRIPCSIPLELLDAAANGTVSKFTVRSKGEDEEDVAEIVFSSF